MSVRVTQALAEVLTRTTAPARVTQALVEVLSATHAGARVTQVLAEVLSAHGHPVPRCEPLPEWIAYGATGGPEWGTALFAAPGGWEAAHSNVGAGTWALGRVVHQREQGAGDSAGGFLSGGGLGRAGSFCFTDWRDHTFANVIGTGDGITSTFQLVKVYTSGTLSYARPLTRPIVSRLVVTVNGVLTTCLYGDGARRDGAV